MLYIPLTSRKGHQENNAKNKNVVDVLVFDMPRVATKRTRQRGEICRLKRYIYVKIMIQAENQHLILMPKNKNVVDLC